MRYSNLHNTCYVNGRPVFQIDLLPHAQLRPLEVWHASEFASHMNRARGHITPWVGPAVVTTTVGEARAVMERYAASAAIDGPRLYGIWCHGELSGAVMFVRFDYSVGVCELGCWLEPRVEGRGLMTTACRVLLAWAFEVRGVHRAEWRCRADNTRSVRVAQRLKMRLEGVRRQAWPTPDCRYDEQQWAILAPEWRAGVSHGPRGLATDDAEAASR